MWPPPKARTAFQCCFFAWFAAADWPTGLRPHVLERTDSVIRPGLVGYAGVLCVLVSPREATVAVERDRICWDLFYSEDVAVARVRGGYICELCTIDPPVVHERRETLWAEHLFEPLRRWIMDSLGNHPKVVFEGNLQEGFTAAHLAPAAS